MNRYLGYMLRTCGADMTSRGGFRWPKRGQVTVPDWNPKPVCGGGLHGLLWGRGSSGLLDWSEDAVWQVVGINKWVEIDGDKIKVPAGYVIYSGDRKGATDAIIRLGADPSYVPGAFRTGGYESTLTGGDRSTLTGGDWSTLTGGYWDGSRYRIATAYPGENGIKINTPYRYNATTNEWDEVTT